MRIISANASALCTLATLTIFTVSLVIDFADSCGHSNNFLWLMVLVSEGNFFKILLLVGVCHKILLKIHPAFSCLTLSLSLYS